MAPWRAQLLQWRKIWVDQGKGGFEHDMLKQIYQQPEAIRDTMGQGMPAYVLRKITDALNQEEQPPKGSRVLILGVTYKSGSPRRARILGP